MEGKEELEQKEVRILKCVSCRKEYIFDARCRKCPECGGTLADAVVDVKDFLERHLK